MESKVLWSLGCPCHWLPTFIKHTLQRLETWEHSCTRRRVPLSRWLWSFKNYLFRWSSNVVCWNSWVPLSWDDQRERASLRSWLVGAWYSSLRDGCWNSPFLPQELKSHVQDDPWEDSEIPWQRETWYLRLPRTLRSYQSSLKQEYGRSPRLLKRCRWRDGTSILRWDKLRWIAC